MIFHITTFHKCYMQPLLYSVRTLIFLVSHSGEFLIMIGIVQFILMNISSSILHFTLSYTNVSRQATIAIWYRGNYKGLKISEKDILCEKFACNWKSFIATMNTKFCLEYFFESIYFFSYIIIWWLLNNFSPVVYFSSSFQVF